MQHGEDPKFENEHLPDWVQPSEGQSMNRGGWSWKRQVGLTSAKRRVSKATGIPWTKSGRQRKVGSIFWKLFK